MKNIYTLVNYILVIISAVLLYSCACSKCGKDETIIPQRILEKADAFIISQTGKEFKKLYITPDFYQSKFDTPYYNIVYRFQIPDKKYVDETIEFSMDTLGNVMKDRDIIGIPDCMDSPENCEFNIDEEKAKSIAAEKGLEPGIKDWKTGFMWNAKYKKYVWHILSTSSEMNVEGSFRGSGKEILIDPNSGEVIESNNWNVR